MAEVAADMGEGRRLSINATPTSFVNGILVIGAEPYEALRNIIESELKVQKSDDGAQPH